MFHLVHRWLPRGVLTVLCGARVCCTRFTSADEGASRGDRSHSRGRLMRHAECTWWMSRPPPRACACVHLVHGTRAPSGPRLCPKFLNIFFHKTIHMVPKHHNIHFPTINHHYNGAWRAGTKPRACTTRRPVMPNFFDSFVFPQNHPHGLKTLQYTLHNHQLPLQWCMARGHQATWMHHVHAPRGARLCPIFWNFFFLHKTTHMVPKHYNIHFPTINFHYNGDSTQFFIFFYFFNILIYKKKFTQKILKKLCFKFINPFIILKWTPTQNFV